MQDRQPVWLSDQGCDLVKFNQLVERTASPADYPLVSEISKNIPIYDGDRLRLEIATEHGAYGVMEEFNRLFFMPQATTGPTISNVL